MASCSQPSPSPWASPSCATASTTIELIINRALVYGALTVALASVYVRSVGSLQSALRALTGPESTLRVVACNLSIAALLSREREAREEGRFPLFPLSSKRFRERPQEEMEELRLARERERADRHRAVMYTNLGSGVVAHKDGALELTWRAGEGVGQVCALPRCTAPATTS